MPAKMTRFKEYLVEIGMTHQELAKQTGLCKRTIRRLEDGETPPRPATLSAIANVLKLTPDELRDIFPGCGSPPPPVPGRGRRLTPRKPRPKATRNNLRQYRERKMLSRFELAKLAGVNPITISLLEDKAQDARMTTRRKLLVALGVPFENMKDVFPDPESRE